jgi:hypothetical protein
MKKLLFVLLLTIPFVGFGQDISGTGWKITDQDGTQKIYLFESDGTFTYLRVKSDVLGDEDETWELDGNKIIFKHNDGYSIYSGTINSSWDFMSGMRMNTKGEYENFSGELIKF